MIHKPNRVMYIKYSIILNTPLPLHNTRINFSITICTPKFNLRLVYLYLHDYKVQRYDSSVSVRNLDKTY
uniref:Uncharacterized protein n=1 Tax=Pararge aegeria TaxID=116150 RepID=S4NXP5_9NEOP